MKITVCVWKSCSDKFSNYIIERLKNDKNRFNLDSLIIEESMCMWRCKEWPNVSVDWDIRNYINPLKASDIAFWKSTKKKNNNKK